MRRLSLIAISLLTLLGQVTRASSVTCIFSNLPESRQEMFVLLKTDSGSAFGAWARNGRGEVQESLLVKDLKCVEARSDFRVINCIHLAPPQSSRVSDVSLTLIRHTSLSAGPVLTGADKEKDFLSEHYRMVFRDGREPGKDFEKNFFLAQCRASNLTEENWLRSLLKNQY